MSKYSLFLGVLFILAACGTDENNTMDTSPGNDPSEEENLKLNNEDHDSDNTDQENSNDDENNENEEVLSSPEGLLEVHFIDAGQADATLFLFEDDGSPFSILYDAGDWTRTDVVDYLHNQELDGIDIMIASHPHADHIGQMAIIIDEFDVDEVWMSGEEHSSATYESVIDAVLSSDAVYEEPRTGDEFVIGDTELTILNPDHLTGDLHDSSLSIKLTYGQHSFVLTGDAELSAEERMIDSGIDLQADVLHLGHHGSRTSTSEAFLDAVSPSYAIISAGIDNSYGHPHEEVTDRILSRDIEIFATYEHGTIIMETDGEGLSISTDQSAEITGNQERSSENNSDSSSDSDETNANEAMVSDCIDINNANAGELKEIIHIGEARAEELISLRPFDSLESLTQINGISSGRLTDIKEENLACIGGN